MTLMPWVLADMMPLAMTCSFLHVVEWTRESMCLLGFAMCRLQHPLRTRSVSGMNWRVSTLKFPTSGKSTTSVAPRGRAPPDHSHRDLEILQAKYAQLSLALEESLHASSSRRRGRSPSFTSHRVVSPSDAHHSFRPDSSSLHRPHLSPRPRSPSQVRSRSRDDYSGHHRHSRRSQERYLERFVSSAAPTHHRRPRSRESPSPKRLEFSRESPSQHHMQFASRGSPSQHQMRFASRGSPSPKRMGFASDPGPSSSKRPLSRDSRSPRPRSSRDSLSPRRGSPSPKRRRYESRDSVSPRRQHSSRASSREASLERPHSRSSPTHPYSPSREDREADDTSMPAQLRP